MIKFEKLGPILELLQKHGVQHIKMEGLELSFLDVKPTQVAPEAPAPVSGPIKHETEELSSLLKLDDTSLVDRLFPEPIEPKETVQ